MLHRGLGNVFIGLVLSLSLPQNIEATITVEFESPAEGQPVAGIGTVQGFTFSDTAGVSITEVALSVDGTFVSSIPCCSERGDVAGAFPALPPHLPAPLVPRLGSGRDTACSRHSAVWAAPDSRPGRGLRSGEPL